MRRRRRYSFGCYRTRATGILLSCACRINAKNGFITFGSDGTPGFVPHDREHRQRHVLPLEWHPERKPTEAPFLKKLLDGSFEDDSDKQQKIDLMGEILGAAALGNVTRLKEPKAFVLHGRSAGMASRKSST